ncbi:MAG TPA: XRE family transcriptional regulator [Candidatus Angelobacter sp.]|nr:XRE family transcriptional regulator [Candidatus Angelobacter sp.]
MPISDALRAELAQYLIGQKLRALRLRRSMGLTQLGQRTGLSPALLSKIENGKLVPTIPTLLRIATVFDVTLDHFFQNEHRRHIISVTRKREREKSSDRRLPLAEGYDLERLDLGAGDRKFQPYLAEFSPGTENNPRPHMHQGFEFLHILKGKLELVIGSDATVLEAGDSIYFDSNLRHGYRGLGQEACTALMVLAYPERNLSERRMDNLAALHGSRRHQVSRANGTLQALENAQNGKDAPPVNES